MSNEGIYRNIHQDLIDRCREGDSQAQFEMYRLYYKAMYNVSLRILGNPHDAEDTMQEAFFKAFDKLGSYRNEVSFGAWLRRIVVNASIDCLKKRRVSFSSIDEAQGLKADDMVDDTVAESVEEVKEALALLPHGYRVVLSLNLIDGYDHDEIAEMLGVTPSTSRSQLSRARQKLIELLRKNPKAK